MSTTDNELIDVTDQIKSADDLREGDYAWKHHSLTEEINKALSTKEQGS